MSSFIYIHVIPSGFKFIAPKLVWRPYRKDGGFQLEFPQFNGSPVLPAGMLCPVKGRVGVGLTFSTDPQVS